MEKLSEYFIIEDDGSKKTSELLAECHALFPVWSCFLDEKLDKDFPPIKTRYKYKKVIEADKELKSLSANNLKKQGIACITLRERLIMELQYFKETGGHLDIDNWTLCAGSRDSDGLVPHVDSHDGRLDISRYGPGLVRDSLRARQRFPF